MSMMVSFVLSFFPRDVLDEILNLIESVSEDFPSYSFSSLREHLQFNFNSHVFIDQIVWYVPCMIRFVFKRGPFCLKTWSVLS